METSETLKLYQIPRGSKIKVADGIITFDHIDGLYSYCTAGWVKEGEYNVLHLHSNTPLKKVGDYYEIATVTNEQLPPINPILEQPEPKVDLITVNQAAAILGQHNSNITRLYKTGEIKGYKQPSGRVLIELDSVMARKAAGRGYSPQGKENLKKLYPDSYKNHYIKKADRADSDRITAKQAASILGMSVAWVYRWSDKLDRQIGNGGLTVSEQKVKALIGKVQGRTRGRLTIRTTGHAAPLNFMALDTMSLDTKTAKDRLSVVNRPTAWQAWLVAILTLQLAQTILAAIALYLYW